MDASRSAVLVVERQIRSGLAMAADKLGCQYLCGNTTEDLGGGREVCARERDNSITILIFDDADSKLDLTTSNAEVHELPVAWGKTTSSFTPPQKLAFAWVKEQGVLGGIDGASVTDDSAHVRLTITDLNVQDQQEKSTVLQVSQRVQDLDEEMRVAVETWEAAQEFVLNVEEQVEMRQLKVCMIVCVCVYVRECAYVRVCVCVTLCVHVWVCLPAPSFNQGSFLSLYL